MENDVLEGQEQTRPKTPVWVYAIIGCWALILLIVCLCLALIFLAPFFLMYIDTNYIWCDVFGPLIPGCP